MPSYYESNYTGSEVDAAVKKIKDNVYVEKTTTINGKSLEQNVVLTASDIEGVASVVANPSAAATDNLNKITVGDTTYSVGGGGDITAAGNNTFTGENTFTKTVKFENNIQNSAGNDLTLPNKAGAIALMSDITDALGTVENLLADLDTGTGV